MQQFDHLYSLLNRQVNHQLCALDTPFINQLAALSKSSASNLKIVSFVLKDRMQNRGEIAQRGVSASEKSVIDINKLTPLVEPRFGTLANEIARYRAHSLAIPDSANFADANRDMLMIDYLLGSSLCFVEVFDSGSVTKFFATRNRFIAGELAGLEPKDTAEYVNYLTAYPANYETRQLKVLKISATNKAFKITKPRSSLDFNRSIKVTPLFLMTSFVEGLSDILNNNIVKFTYIKDNMTEREFITTMSVGILNRFYDTETVAKIFSGIGTFLNRGYVRVPELGLSKYDASGVRALNVSRITSIEVVNSFDTSFIDVDFDRIMPNFKETIFQLRDQSVLGIIYEELINRPASGLSVPELRDAIVSFVEGQYTVGTTTALRQLHKYMDSRKNVFKAYNGGKPVDFGGNGFNGANGNGFNMGVIE